jgi:hypothetical protein
LATYIIFHVFYHLYFKLFYLLALSCLSFTLISFFLVFCIYPQVAIIDIFTEGLCFFPNIYWYLCRDVEREAEAAARGAGVPAILDPGRRVLGQLRRDQLRDNMPHGRRRLR